MLTPRTDGHGGREVADYCAKSLAVCLKHKLSTLGEDQIGEAMTQAYVEIDRSIQGWAKYVGCTALSAYFIDHFFYIANVGDSRVVLAQAGKAQRLSTDHKPGTCSSLYATKCRANYRCRTP